MTSIANQLPPEIAGQLHPDRVRNEAGYWAARDSLLAEYEGKWIGFADGTVVASGTSPVAVFHEAEASGTHLFVVRVGKEELPSRVRRAASSPARRWRDKFAEAGNGVWLAVTGESSFAVHLPAAALVLAAAGLLGCEWMEWCLLIGCVGAVLAAETFNAALETLFHALDNAAKSRMTGCLDRAAGAVLLTSVTAAVVGAIVLGRRLLM